jgi:hypothetical protein
MLQPHPPQNHKSKYHTHTQNKKCLDPPSNASWVMGTRDATYGQGANLSMAMLLRNTSASVLIGAIHTSEGMSNVASYFEVYIIIEENSGK